MEQKWTWKLSVLTVRMMMENTKLGICKALYQKTLMITMQMIVQLAMFLLQLMAHLSMVGQHLHQISKPMLIICSKV